MRNPRAGFPFIALGIAFVLLGMTSNRTFLYVGIVFVLAGIALLARGGRST